MKTALLSLIILSNLCCSSGYLNNVAISALNSKETSIESTKANVATNELNWYFQVRNDGLPPEGPKECQSFINNYNAYHLGDTSKKVLYITFDEGYENGYTPQILDILKKHNAKAAFFVVKPYIKQNPDIVKRMLEEGHLVCNHSDTHPSMASIADKDKFQKEFTAVEEEFAKISNGATMPKFFRPPMGKYSERSLKYTDDLGYKTIFWSFAYHDWDPKNQPSHEKAKNTIYKRTHNGGIILLHAVSKTNTEILDEVLTHWENEGFEFKTLNDLPQK